jgi:hypothetical protein
LEKRTLAAIERRFPGTKEIVQREFNTSESFRGLCRDYATCATALARWQESESEEGRARSREYSELLAELTEELGARLHAHEA